MYDVYESLPAPEGHCSYCHQDLAATAPAQTEAETAAETATETETEAKTETKTETEAETKAEAKTETSAETEPETKTDTTSCPECKAALPVAAADHRGSFLPPSCVKLPDSPLLHTMGLEWLKRDEPVLPACERLRSEHKHVLDKHRVSTERLMRLVEKLQEKLG